MNAYLKLLHTSCIAIVVLLNESISFSNYDGHIWDIHPDGTRFLMMKSPPGTEDESTTGIPRKFNIVVNWFEELKERVHVN